MIGLLIETMQSAWSTKCGYSTLDVVTYVGFRHCLMAEISGPCVGGVGERWEGVAVGGWVGG